MPTLYSVGFQSLFASGFQRLERTLDRILFLQEAADVLTTLTFVFELDREYSASEISHFRAFCGMHLKEIKHDIFAVLFGTSDKANRCPHLIVATRKTLQESSMGGAEVNGNSTRALPKGTLRLDRQRTRINTNKSVRRVPSEWKKFGSSRHNIPMMMLPLVMGAKLYADVRSVFETILSDLGQDLL